MPAVQSLMLVAATASSVVKESTREEWSTIVGYASLFLWVIVYTPQLLENYQNKSGEGLSLAFVFIWLLGDLLNLVGSIRQELLITMILLAAYYSICDVLLLGQYYYYKKYYINGVRISTQTEGLSETSPLLNDHSVEANVNGSSISHARTGEQQYSFKKEALKFVGAALLIAVASVAAWHIQKWNGRKEIPGEPQPPKDGPGWKWDAQISGWLSAALYLCSRVPQIFKNRVTKCEGLSLALFVAAIGGNLTYVASILIKSTEHEYIIENLSWLVGSLGTVFLDFIVLGQFFTYRFQGSALN